MTNRSSGISFRSNAVLEVKIDGWLVSIPGIIAEEDPDAIIHFSNDTLNSSSSLITLISSLETNEARPWRV